MTVFTPRWTRTRVTVALLTITAIALVPFFATSLSRGFGSDASDRLFASTLSRRGSSTDQTITTLQQQLKDNPDAFGAYIALSNAYLQQVRETGDPALYEKTDALLKRAERLDALNPELFASRANLALARHDFAGALKLGQQARVFDPENARYYGLVADAQIELGMYDEAITSLEGMVGNRPNFNSYSRIAYVRELYGDPEGAIEAMEFAIAAGSAVPENKAWAYVQLGNLWFGFGNLEDAAHNYDLALKTLPDYPAAQAGQARVAAAQGNLPQAATLYQRALNQLPTAEYAVGLGDVYTKQGNQALAQEQYQLVQVIDKLMVENGVNTDLETALFMADHDIDLTASLQKARAAYTARPSVHAADVLAWTLYKTGDYPEAQRYATEALKLGTRDSIKLFHAGMIAKALGQQTEAKQYLQQATELNTHFSLIYSDIAAASLQALNAQATSKGSK